MFWPAVLTRMLGAIKKLLAPRHSSRPERSVSAAREFRLWSPWKISAYALAASPTVFFPMTSFAQSCGVTPMRWVYHYWNFNLEGFAPTATAGCAAFDGHTWTANNITSTVVSSTVAAGSVEIPGPDGGARCEQYYTSTNHPNIGNPNWIGLASVAGPCPQFSVTAAPPLQSEVSCKNCVADPVNPGVGNVYKSEEDVRIAGASPIAFRRFYNSADAVGSDGTPGWRHSYSRYINTVYQTPSSPYPGQSAMVSAQFGTPQNACTQGFPTIRASVVAWQSAIATYTDGVCVLSTSAGTIGTLPIQSNTPMAAPANPIEYDLVRDDGQILRYTLQNGTINNPRGTSIQLAVTSSGFTVTDDQDNVENYNAGGVLQSITSPAGVVQTVSYDSNGLFSAVTDSFGNSLAATRNAQGNIATVAINGASPIQYSYDAAGRLFTVTNLDNTALSYVYTGVSLLNSVVDESGTTYTTWTYNAQNQATKTTGPGGANATTVAYTPDGSVTATDALGATRTFSYTRVGDINRVISISGSQCPSCDEMAATTYDAFGWVSSRTDYNGNVTCYANDPLRGLELVRVEGFAPGSTCPSDLGTYILPSGTSQRKISTTWSSSYRLPTQITEATRTTSFAYDPSGNVRTKTITDTTASPNVSRTWTYTYNSYGQVLTAEGPRTDTNDATTYTYYTCTTGSQCGQVQTVTNAAGHVWTYNSYDAYGQPLKITDPNGVVTILTYDARERLTSRSIAGETTGFGYYPTGLLKTVTLPDNSTFTYTYDGAHRLTQISDGLANKIVYTLDAMGNRKGENTYDPSGALHRTHTRVFNTLSELYQDVNAANTAAVTTTYGYDGNGNQSSASAPLARNTGELYDALNRLMQITDPANGVTGFTYDANDNLVSVTDPRALVTSYHYNGFGDLVSQLSPDTGSTRNTYDSAGNLATSTDARGALATYSYDALNRVTSVAYSSGGTADQTLTFTYDAGANGKGHLTGASDANHSLTWSYDTLGRVINKSQTVAGVIHSVGYSYSLGDLSTLTTPSRQTVNYGYNANHQITSVSVNGTIVLNGVTYEPLGPVNSWTWGNGITVSRTVNGDGLITQITEVYQTPPQSCPTGQTLMWNDTGSFDGNPNQFFSTPAAAAQAHDARVNAYYHCSCAALTGVTQSSWNLYVASYTWNGSGPSTFNVPGSCQGAISYAVSLGYTFDDADRITAITNASNSALSWSYGYDALDRLTTASTAANTYGWTYDSNGNRLTETGPSPSTYAISPASNQITGITGALARTYGYDAAGHTTSYSDVTATYNDAGRLQTAARNSDTESFIYNALGQRIETTGGPAGTVLYWYDEQGHLLGEYDGSGSLIEETVWLGDIPVATLRPNGSGVAIYYVHTDHLNTPRQVTRPADNAQMWTWFSDPFGTDAANSNPSGAGTFAYNLRFPGQIFDGQAGLHDNGFRAYDPATGRYVESDPIGLAGGVNSYSYALQNPISGQDPLGLYCISTGQSVSCSYPGGPAFTLPVQGFPDINASNRALYHKYDVQRDLGCANPQDVLQSLINNPTPGNPSPATPGGTPNYAPVPFFGDNPVTSWLTTDLNTGLPLVINITGPGSAFSPGYVAREVVNGVAHTYGEGLNPWQSPAATAGWIQDIANELLWGRQLSGFIKKAEQNCGCKQ
jgi:RHS repeat-associated protein